MKKDRIIYETPVSETLVVRFEGRILDIVSPGQNQAIPDSEDFSGKGGWE